MGYPFYIRNAHGVEQGATNSISPQLVEQMGKMECVPAFQLFLDCCYQIMRQYPHEFAFTHFLLLMYFEEAFACKYGNYLLNSERERKELEIYTKTQSLWSEINKEKKQLRTHMFKPSQEGAILPNKADIYLWKELYIERSKARTLYHLYNHKNGI